MQILRQAGLEAGEDPGLHSHCSGSQQSVRKENDMFEISLDTLGNVKRETS